MGRRATAGGTAGAALAAGMLVLAACAAGGGGGPGGGAAGPVRRGGRPVPSAAARPAARPAVDFDGDGYGDVAVGAGDGTVRGRERAGGVVVLRGSARGLARPVAVTRDSPGVPGPVRADEGFGGTVGAGDLDGDGRTDLALGDPDAGEGAGRLVVRYGGARGLRPGGTEVTQRTPGVPGPVPGADAAYFGHAVAVRDTDGDGRAEVAVGVPDDGGPGPARAGVVLLLRGGPHGLSVRGVREVVSGRPAPEGVQEVFGGTVLLADVTGDGRTELLSAATGADDGHGVLHVSCAARPGPCPAAAAVGRAGLRGLPAADAFGFGGALAG
ncbi:hypothetical protein [Streptomyces sp. NPDC001380]|uniref:hypothetical protein n=1 Tax=Streptomyces sp. NPDC001380 TaxID=3364566 RepID=UPI0036B8BBEC